MESPLYTDVLCDLREGKLVMQLTDELAELVQDVKATGVAGKLTLELNLSLHAQGGNVMIITPKIKVTTPRAKIPPAILFANEEGHLSRDDHTQTRMFADGAKRERQGS